jgi:hypothetical protein
MSSTLKCLDKLTGQNKCPDKKTPTKVYCDTRTGKCYTSTKLGKPHGFKSQQESAEKEGETLAYDEKYKLFGFPNDIKKHIKIFSKSEGEEDFDALTMQCLPMEQLKKIAKDLDPDWNVKSHTSSKALTSAIYRKQKEQQRTLQIQEVEEELQSPLPEREYDQDEFDRYDIWVNELNKQTHPILVEYIPWTSEIIEKSVLQELKAIWAEV